MQTSRRTGMFDLACGVGLQSQGSTIFARGFYGARIERFQFFLLYKLHMHAKVSIIGRQYYMFVTN